MIPARARPLLFPRSYVALEYEIVFSVTDSCFIEMKLIPSEANVPAGLLAQTLLLPWLMWAFSDMGMLSSLKSMRRGGNFVMSKNEMKPSLAIRRSVSL